MKFKTSLIAIGFVGSLALFPFAMNAAPNADKANAQAASQANNPIRDARLAFLSKTLNLDVKQQEQAGKILAKFGPELQSYQQKLRDNGLELMSLSQSDKFSDAQAQSLANKQGELVAQLAALQAQQKNAIWKILTPEQQEQVKSMEQRMEKKMMQMHEGHKHHHS